MTGALRSQSIFVKQRFVHDAIMTVDPAAIMTVDPAGRQ